MTTPDLFEHAANQADAEQARTLRAHSESFDRIAEGFHEWKHTPSGRHILDDLYRMAAGCVRDWKRFGIKCGTKYLFEMERRRIRTVRKRLRAQGADLEKWNGYALNNDFSSLVARHMIERRPAWEGMFELRKRKGEE